MNDSYSFLRRVTLFADLTNAELEQICKQVEEVRLHAGEILFEEGSIGEQAYVIREGQIEIYKQANRRSVQLAVRQSGEMIGEMALLESTLRSASGRALTDSLLYSIGQATFDDLLNNNPSVARTMLHTVIARMRTLNQMLSQSEKMAQLGTLTAGIAHELNNPASAVKRGSEQFKAALTQFQQHSLRLNELRLSASQMQILQGLAARSWTPITLTSLERNDRETALEAWLDEIGIENSWQHAPLLVNLGYAPPALKQILSDLPSEALPAGLHWVTASIDLYNIADEVSQSAGRISEIIGALKSYVYLDQAPLQQVSIEEGLENTLVILRHKLNQGIEIERDYDPAVPPIQAYGGELNQVWTNIIDNAIDAMDGHGKLTIRTVFKEPWVVIDIADNGPGIAPEIQSKLFSPFFTTKPLGKGTGLGLNISYNIIHKHGGDVKVISQPGSTHFEVWLPEDFQKVIESEATLKPIHRSDDNSLREILQSIHNIAVVGISDKPDQPAHDVPAYLQSQGYRIFPINPRFEQVLDEITYPDLSAVPDMVDLVLIFLASEFVPPVVDEAIQIGAKVVWMQEGIVNEAAAQKASQAGVEVVMDTCIQTTHKRLFH